MGLKSESTGNKYKKAEKMWNDFSDDTGAFRKLNKMEINDIQDASGTPLAISLTVISTWILSESKPALDGKKISLDSKSHVKDYWKNLCCVGKENIFCFL